MFGFRCVIKLNNQFELQKFDDSQLNCTLFSVLIRLFVLKRFAQIYNHL